MTIRKSIHVKRSVEDSFRLFTRDIGKWWPLKEGFSLEHRGWERAGAAAAKQSTGYGQGWDTVLARYAAA
jgi:hypothetical protein